MSIAILFNQKSTEEWFNRLTDLLPNEKIEVYPAIENFSAVKFLITWKPHQDYINEFPNVKVVQSVGAGIDNLLHTKLPKDVVVTRIVDPALQQDMYEHVLSCILASMKNIIPYYNNQLENNWQPKNYLTIENSTITVLGLGEIGGFVAQKLDCLGFKVKGWSKSKKEIEGINTFYGEDGLENAINQTNFIVNILPLTNETQGILNESFLSKVSVSTVLINVGRGGHLVDEALVKAIDTNQIKEAYLDVFYQEPLSKSHPFWQHPSIYITPHIASITNPETAILQVVDNYRLLQEEKDLNFIVDLKRGY